MSHITDLLDHADRDPHLSTNAMRYNQALPPAGTPKPWRCLWCGVVTEYPIRGCCSALHARLEHDYDDHDPED
jgi:hypothetical protein